MFRRCFIVSDYLEQFEELLDTVINNETSEGFEEFRRRVIKRLEEID